MNASAARRSCFCRRPSAPPAPPPQATHGGEGATNAAIAARPGLEVFLKALELVQTRDIDTSSEANAIKVR